MRGDYTYESDTNSTAARLGASIQVAIIPAMAKEDKKSKTKGSATSKADKDEDEDSGSHEVELEEVKEKKGEPDDNLKRRAEWFQKRSGG